ncbi:Cytosolic Fe-S cluster assembly factor NBP35 [Raphanus sativus]|uniref:Cytosolic Fe-S cluster assembly factor NBP35 n=1 Tax=Raphanus sativus TaxID=3726 RepID=A0A6J0NCI1_RAPSA|nr:cytosolic Fe-S cluster assembly factor NBP35-like [Raphanus sativus]KAJ4899914.1 Cytosolic Fe-S cluster assembly factor NBP35 [Raphanus sativus]
MDKGEIPENANEHCPGPQAETAGKSESCAGCPNQQACATGTAPSGPDPDLVAIAGRMANVKHKILVLSCKGGVGKSTFSAQLSFALAGMDHQVGLLDLDICGPSMPKMLGLEGHRLYHGNYGWTPVYVERNLGVVSISFTHSESDDEPAIWRGPRKDRQIKEFLQEVHWGDRIDYLVVDTPPGTSDEHITIVNCLKDTGIDGAIIVTTPQEVAMADVRKGVSFCKKVGVNVLGVVENMSGLTQPLSDVKFMMLTRETGSSVDVTQDMISCVRENAPKLLDGVFAWSQVFESSGGGAERMCEELGVPFLGKVPLDPQLCRAAERGKSCFEGNKCAVSAPALKSIIEKVVASIKMKEET